MNQVHFSFFLFLFWYDRPEISGKTGNPAPHGAVSHLQAISRPNLSTHNSAFNASPLPLPSSPRSFLRQLPNLLLTCH